MTKRWLNKACRVGLGAGTFLFAVGALAQTTPHEAFLGQLQRYRSTHPVEAEVWMRARVEDGKGEKHRERVGEIGFRLKDGPEGLNVMYPAELLESLQEERLIALRDPDAASPTLTAFNELDMATLKDLTDAASTLARHVRNAEFLGESVEECASGECWALEFRFGDERISSASKRFIKEFEGRLRITVDADGRPLAAETSQHAKGRAFVFLTFRSDAEEVWEFADVDGRLITRDYVAQRETAGGGERGSRRLEYRLAAEGIDPTASLLCRSGKAPGRTAAQKPAPDFAAEPSKWRQSGSVESPC